MNGFHVSQMSEDAHTANLTILTNHDELILKKCPVCKTIKQISDFGKNVISKNGLQYYCKKCMCFYNKQHPCKTRKPYKTLKEGGKIRKPESLETRAKRKIYRAKNKEKIRDREKIYKAKIRSTPSGRLNGRMSQSVRLSLRDSKQGLSWESLVGYTSKDLKKHLEKQFKDGMDWDKFMSGEIHIDHIIPVKIFNFKSSSDYEFKKCWALKNLQPLWAKDNISKGSKLIKHYQPSLAI